MKQFLEPIIALAAVIGIIMGGLSYFATAEDLRLVEMRLDQKIMSDQMSQVQQRIWTLEDRNQGKPCSEWKSQDEKDEYRKLKELLRQTEERQKVLMKK
jgi:aspartate/glutamate racemase